MDNNLMCDATRCIHNNSNHCYAGVINIEGRHSDDIENTYCFTFEEKDSKTLTNSVQFTDESKATSIQNIKCDAIKCAHNINKSCTSPDVRINSGNASCNMFVEK